jgi:hypothetical protein
VQLNNTETIALKILLEIHHPIINNRSDRIEQNPTTNPIELRQPVQAHISVEVLFGVHITPQNAATHRPKTTSSSSTATATSHNDVLSNGLVDNDDNAGNQTAERAAAQHGLDLL